MKLILDAHCLIWWVDQDHLLSRVAYDEIADSSNELFVSAATVWEIAIQFGQGKLTLSQPFRPWIEHAVRDLEAVLLDVTIAAADVQSQLPRHHGDPFDRMMVAQSQLEAAPIVSRDSVLDEYGIHRIW